MMLPRTSLPFGLPACFHEPGPVLMDRYYASLDIYTRRYGSASSMSLPVCLGFRTERLSSKAANFRFSDTASLFHLALGEPMLAPLRRVRSDVTLIIHSILASRGSSLAESRSPRGGCDPAGTTTSGSLTDERASIFGLLKEISSKKSIRRTLRTTTTMSESAA
jgi:hypothetical protein